MIFWIQKHKIVATFLGFLACCGIICLVLTIAGLRRTLTLMQTHMDLKMIGMALHQYHDKYGSFPPVAIRDGEGKAIHSWRAIIVQMIERDPDVDDSTNYDFSQSWNSPTNQAAVRPHWIRGRQYHFLAVVGPHAAWAKTGVRIFRDFTDGSSDTAMIIGLRNSRGHHWAEPVDAELDGNGSLIVNGHPIDLTDENIFLLMADGSVRYASRQFVKENMPALFTIDAGDKVQVW